MTLSLSECCQDCPRAAVAPPSCGPPARWSMQVLRAPSPAPSGGHNSACGSRGHTFNQALSGCRQRAPGQQDSVLAASAGPPDSCSAAAELRCRSVATRRFSGPRSGRRQSAARDAARRAVASPKRAAVEPHPVHDRRQLAGDRDSGTLVAAALRDAQTPRLQPRLRLAVDQ